ncbi:MarR family winged helix-turn-helix transcriptional regulator [Streptomyces sp. NPDC059696]|uniref:MarR family winged helix-turn-helix transcriptional regulator n=1 Tax=Streptomyces sp. NPDC059696 TaxID=3346911 RepID=UPI0036C2677C
MTPTEGPSPTGNDPGRAPRQEAGTEPEARAGAADAGATAGADTGVDGSSAGVGPAGGRRDDTVASVVRQWQAVRPGLATGPMEIIGRINRCAALLQQAEDAPLRRAGLSRPEFDLLGALRRTGHELTPGELARETFSSGAAVTKRLKQLTERGLVERRGDTRDRRVVHLRLTDAGRDLVDGLLPVQLAYETSVLSGLDGLEQGELADLLGELLSRLEGRAGMLRP